MLYLSIIPTYAAYIVNLIFLNGQINDKCHDDKSGGERIMTLCDMIKRNESDVGDVVFEILAKTVFNVSVI